MITGEEITSLLNKKWRKYVISLLVLLIISLAIPFSFLIHEEIVIFKNNVLTSYGKLFMLYIVLYFSINMVYFLFISKRLERYKNKLEELLKLERKI